MVHQTAMYYEDRLSGAGFSRVVLAGAGTPAQGSPQPRRSGRGLPPPCARAAAGRQGRCRRSEKRGDADGSHHGERGIARRARAARRPAGAGTGGLTSMLRTNLSTRPFYNERAVQWLLGRHGGDRRRC